jgi:S-DNA-T family DNA segregation ATPase FtsK/SpoIIIE
VESSAEAAGAPTLPVAPPEPEEPPPAAKPRQQDLFLEPAESGYALPPLELLNEAVPQEIEDEQELVERARHLTEKFHEFAIEGNVVAIHPGPVVTTFEFKPDAGVKYSKMTGMVDDLCLALKAESVRIDRIPGRSTVGIEVPNRRQEIIYPRELLADETFTEASSKLTLALGKNINGEAFVSELSRMPHLLIAGATGAGKSVALNGMIASMLYKATPADVRFIMIDTKMIELGIYADIPHLLVPVVTDPKKASTALKWAVREMETRYRQLAAVGVRNIDQFNELLEEEPDRSTAENADGEEIELHHLPYIVIVIDEMADLMMVTAADVEESIMRLAQMARAVGIHLLLATQRPSVDVITGTIKANFPSRIAFRVSQRVDSRTIIDQMGAEQLLGKGDMLFLPPGSARLIRLHGGFITEPELNRITAFLKKQAKPSYDESVLKEPEEERVGYDNGERDLMFLEAVRLVLQEGQCSITLIQRRLRLGYARAARIVDMMEQEGIVGPADGSKPREVLVGPEILETLEASP